MTKPPSKQLLVALTRRPVWQALSPVFRYSTRKEEKSQEKPKNSFPVSFPRPRTTPWAAPRPQLLQRCDTHTAQRALGLLTCSLLRRSRVPLSGGWGCLRLSQCLPLSPICPPEPWIQLWRRDQARLSCVIGAYGGPGAQQMPCVQNADPLAPCVAVAPGILHSPISAEESLPPT